MAVPAVRALLFQTPPANLPHKDSNIRQASCCTPCQHWVVCGILASSAPGLARCIISETVIAEERGHHRAEHQGNLNVVRSTWHQHVGQYSQAQLMIVRRAAIYVSKRFENRITTFLPETVVNKSGLVLPSSCFGRSPRALLMQRWWGIQLGACSINLLKAIVVAKN
ncbi:uncharacterized protein EI90DRAFT_952961 [Cantharellus anzutake]|uniref:uncharacterized protein n=1 Tax=Cantharellus anzutake TaxID=1750568 RepID=UPI001904CE44|nr:uncharacterized protein EI90DRAFT_952961 [Cantharellus anzutake]KAF8331623.1 hypothetical protein EI90DRAFT_952961 [Cantharellus anzutake]